MTEYTITFSEKNKGWTSFHSWIPNLMCNINNKFFTVKNGQLYMHHDRDNPVMNTFYGVQYPSTIVQVINEANMEDKIFKNIILESDSSWKATVETNLTNGTIEASEFNRRESKYFGYTRKNEDSTDLTDRVQGIGNIVSVSGTSITYGQMPTLVSVGETLYQLNGSTPEQVGIISNIVGNVITVSAIVTTPIVGYFSYSLKNARVQGAEMRGYYAKVTLENNDDSDSELFAISSNIAKSYAPTQY